MHLTSGKFTQKLHAMKKIKPNVTVDSSLMKTKFDEIKNTLIVAQSFDERTFEKFNGILSVFNQIWRQQEEIKRQRAIEEESLYVNK